MPELYYSGKFDIGDGKFLGVLFVDSCLLLCSNYTFSSDPNIELSRLYNERMLIQRDSECSDPSTVELGNE